MESCDITEADEVRSGAYSTPDDPKLTLIQHVYKSPNRLVGIRTCQVYIEVFHGSETLTNFVGRDAQIGSCMVGRHNDYLRFLKLQHIFWHVRNTTVVVGKRL